MQTIMLHNRRYRAVFDTANGRLFESADGDERLVTWDELRRMEGESAATSHGS